MSKARFLRVLSSRRPVGLTPRRLVISAAASTNSSFSTSSSSSSLPARLAGSAPAKRLSPRSLLFSSSAILLSATDRKGLAERDDEESKDCAMEWEEEEETDPEIGDGGYGGGVVLPPGQWGECLLHEARDVLRHNFPEDLLLYAFKISPSGYIYVRLDKLSNKYGCPSIEEIENFHRLYKNRLDELFEAGQVTMNLALEVSSPGALRLLKPEDMDRFKEMPMKVEYIIDADADADAKHRQQMEGVFLIESIDLEARQYVWKLADVKENRAVAGKGRPLSRKQKDWRLRLPFEAIERIPGRESCLNALQKVDKSVPSEFTGLSE